MEVPREDSTGALLDIAQGVQLPFTNADHLDSRAVTAVNRSVWTHEAEATELTFAKKSISALPVTSQQRWRLQLTFSPQIVTQTAPNFLTITHTDSHVYCRARVCDDSNQTWHNIPIAVQSPFGFKECEYVAKEDAYRLAWPMPHCGTRSGYKESIYVLHIGGFHQLFINRMARTTRKRREQGKQQARRAPSASSALGESTGEQQLLLLGVPGAEQGNSSPHMYISSPL